MTVGEYEGIHYYFVCIYEYILLYTAIIVMLMLLAHAAYTNI